MTLPKIDDCPCVLACGCRCCQQRNDNNNNNDGSSGKDDKDNGSDTPTTIN